MIRTTPVISTARWMKFVVGGLIIVSTKTNPTERAIRGCLNLDTLDNCHQELSVLPERAKLSRDEVLVFIDFLFLKKPNFFFFVFHSSWLGRAEAALATCSRCWDSIAAVMTHLFWPHVKLSTARISGMLFKEKPFVKIPCHVKQPRGRPGYMLWTKYKKKKNATDEAEHLPVVYQPQYRSSWSTEQERGTAAFK